VNRLPLDNRGRSRKLKIPEMIFFSTTTSTSPWTQTAPWPLSTTASAWTVG